MGFEEGGRICTGKDEENRTGESPGDGVGAGMAHQRVLRKGVLGSLVEQEACGPHVKPTFLDWALPVV